VNNCSFPLVSIVMPSYNSASFLSSAIISVINQTYQNWEMLIVDDCSTDNSWQILASFATIDKRIIISKTVTNSGSGPTRNLAIHNAKGKYIAFLDSDDIWTPDRLEKHIEFMQENRCAFSHASYGYMSEDGIILPKEFRVSRKPVTYKILLKKTDISCLTAIYDQDQLGKIFMPNLRRKQDYALWLSILKTGIPSIPFSPLLAYYRQRKDSSTSKKHKLIVQHLKFLKEQEHLSTLNSLWYTANWIVRGIFKYYL
jgi:teichuronic acid biosynthesis glycosyltransferase TuaG